MIQTNQKIKSLELQAVIIRADGSKEDLGAIQYWNSNPIKQLMWRIKTWLR